MFRLSKTTDYGIVLMAQLAASYASSNPASSNPKSSTSGTEDTLARPAGFQADSPSRPPQNARELAENSDLPVPMVSKILKALTKEGLLVSQRGSKGGYSLSKAPEELTVSEMIRVLEGPVALTDCAIGPARCEHESMCAVREPWQVISRVVERALADVTLADLVRGKADASGRQLGSMLQIERDLSRNGFNTDASR